MKTIPITKPYITKDEEKAVISVLRSGWLTQGKEVALFEEEASKIIGCKYAVATSSCTTALHLACVLAGLKKGDEVIVPSYTFVATANAIFYTGARPKFVDVDERTFNIDPEKVKEAITKETKAIMVVHQFGLPADRDAIYRIAKKHKLTVIEDAACAFGSMYKGKIIGAEGRFICFSFHPRKSITTAEGGLLVTDNKDVSEKARMLRSHAVSISAVRRHHAKGILYEQYVSVGYNYRMSDVHAAIGIQQLKKTREIMEKRRILARRYSEFFQNSGDCILPPFESEHCVYNFQSFAVLLTEKVKPFRDEIIKCMAKEGISCRRGIPPIHREPYCVKEFGRVRLPITQSVYERTLLLPLFPDLKLKEQNYVMHTLVQCVKQFMAKKVKDEVKVKKS